MKGNEATCDIRSSVRQRTRLGLRVVLTRLPRRFRKVPVAPALLSEMISSRPTDDPRTCKGRQ